MRHKIPPPPCIKCNGRGSYRHRDPGDLRQVVASHCGRCDGSGIEPRQPPYRGPFMTYPQITWMSEQWWLKSHGKMPLEPKTAAQRELNAGRIPRHPGGGLE